MSKAVQAEHSMNIAKRVTAIKHASIVGHNKRRTPIRVLGGCSLKAVRFGVETEIMLESAPI